MFYLYQFEHYGKYKKVWELVEPRQGYEVTAQALIAMRRLAAATGEHIHNFTYIWFGEAKDVERWVSTPYFSDEEKIRSIFACR